jgi:hypothetical protein
MPERKLAVLELKTTPIIAVPAAPARAAKNISLSRLGGSTDFVSVEFPLFASLSAI